jgi:GH15 family glucan-1,4-alpha-glucosidase
MREPCNAMGSLTGARRESCAAQAAPASSATAARIEDYALIGDCRSGALVSRAGSIDWLALPRFDSPACFAALLGEPDHGHWSLAPRDSTAATVRRYRGDTLILETDFASADGQVRVVDFMAGGDGEAHLVRLVRALRGRLAMRCELIVRFDYGSVVPWASRQSDGRLELIAGPDRLTLQTAVPLRGENLRTVGEFTLEAGQQAEFVLSWNRSYRLPPAMQQGATLLGQVEAFWSGWVRSFRQHGGPWDQATLRSLITLKALIHRDTGGIVAAATTSLPEQLGGARNWDYRFCWLRDATLTLYALMESGFLDEARAWREWLLRAVAGRPEDLQVMYGVAGERRLTEYQIAWLPGYESSAPVRVGNRAARQLQLDVYGEVLDALYAARRSGLTADEASWGLETALVEHLASIWQQPDNGVWEMRGGPRHFTHSKVMAWVAFDRAVRSIEEFGLDGPVARWRRLREQIHAEVCRRGFDATRNSFVQYYGGATLDASLLLIGIVGFLPPDDPRVRGTVAAIERELLRDGLVLRYDTGSGADGLPPGEGAFLACSFWLADNYVLQGRLDEARTLFERLLALRNDLGLLSEEYEPRARRQLGNFPQAFSHLALINCAHNLMSARGPVHQRAGTGVRPQAR